MLIFWICLGIANIVCHVTIEFEYFLCLSFHLSERECKVNEMSKTSSCGLGALDDYFESLISNEGTRSSYIQTTAGVLSAIAAASSAVNPVVGAGSGVISGMKLWLLAFFWFENVYFYGLKMTFQKTKMLDKT